MGSLYICLLTQHRAHESHFGITLALLFFAGPFSTPCPAAAKPSKPLTSKHWRSSPALCRRWHAKVSRCQLFTHLRSFSSHKQFTTPRTPQQSQPFRSILQQIQAFYTCTALHIGFQFKHFNHVIILHSNHATPRPSLIVICNQTFKTIPGTTTLTKLSR